MLLVRYFVFVGGMLIGMLLLADRYLPSTTAATASDNEIDRSIIRIHSGHQWPNAVRMDTSAPMPAAAPATVEAAAPATVDAASPSAPVERTRQAYAFDPAPQKIRRHAKLVRPRSREHSQRFANYQPPDTRGWPPPGW